MFKDSGCYRFCEKIQGSHQQVVEAFSLTFDGSKVVIRREEFQVDEAMLAEVTEIPRIGERWFIEHYHKECGILVLPET